MKIRKSNQRKKKVSHLSAPLWLCLNTMCCFPSSIPPSCLPSLPSSPQSHVCAPRFIPGSFWRGVPRRTEWGAGQPRRFRWGSDSVPTNQCSSKRLLSKPYGEHRINHSSPSRYDIWLSIRSNPVTVFTVKNGWVLCYQVVMLIHYVLHKPHPSLETYT